MFEISIQLPSNLWVCGCSTLDNSSSHVEPHAIHFINPCALFWGKVKCIKSIVRYKNTQKNIYIYKRKNALTYEKKKIPIPFTFHHVYWLKKITFSQHECLFQVCLFSSALHVITYTLDRIFAHFLNIPISSQHNIAFFEKPARENRTAQPKSSQVTLDVCCRLLASAEETKQKRLNRNEV